MPVASSGNDNSLNQPIRDDRREASVETVAFHICAIFKNLKPVYMTIKI